MKKEKLSLQNNLVLFTFGQNIYYEKRKSTISIFQLAKRFLSTKLYAKIR